MMQIAHLPLSLSDGTAYRNVGSQKSFKEVARLEPTGSLHAVKQLKANIRRPGQSL